MCCRHAVRIHSVEAAGSDEAYDHALDAGSAHPVAAVRRAISLQIIKRRRPEWWETNGPIDPIDYWRGVEVPALVVYGEDDELDNVPVRRSVERLRSLGRQNLDIWVYAGSGHALWEPDEWGSVPAGGRQRIRGDFLRRLTAWIHDSVNGGAR